MAGLMIGPVDMGFCMRFSVGGMRFLVTRADERKFCGTERMVGDRAVRKNEGMNLMGFGRPAIAHATSALAAPSDDSFSPEPARGRPVARALEPQAASPLVGESAKPEPAKAAVDQVLGRHAADGPVVAPDVGEAEVVVQVVEIDDGNLRLFEDGGHVRIGHPADHAVAAPIGQPCRRRSAQFVLLEIHAPAALAAQPAGDARENAPPIGDRCLHHQEHVRAFVCRGFRWHGPIVSGMGVQPSCYRTIIRGPAVT